MSEMAGRYQRHSYRRTCDICGLLRQIEEMHLQDELWVCTYDHGERVRTQLDRGNARQRPFTIKPVPHPKPWGHYYPNLLETDDAAVFNFLTQQVSALCRYEYVSSGHAVATSLGEAFAGLSWAARYFYDLIQANEPSRALLIPKAKELLATIADYLQTRQQGFGLQPLATRANYLYYGGLLASGATKYVTNDTATAGLALLYAYRVTGAQVYLVGARAAASYLRNVQAIGSNATQHTSTNAAGMGRLYTGAVCSEVSTVSGADPGERFYSNHLFYPGGLVALEFWNEIKTTDGDQQIGASALLDGFDSIPAQLLSQSIADMRACWETGITDSTGTLVNGFSSTTPREFFNAYPLLKTGFTVVGTGLWEYVDGGSAVGTEITSQNFAMALEALYNYEGATSQVTTISDWLRSFTSNADFETPANTSTSVLYHGTTGTYDPTIAPATLLQVRDPDTFADTKINAASLYDWGSFGMLSRIWASRNRASFMNSRLYPLNIVQRYFDGNFNDGLTSDRIILRGESGLTLQTAFTADSSGNAFPASGSGQSTSSPPSVGLVFWVKGDVGLTSVAGKATLWADQSGFGQNVTDLPANPGPNTGVDTIGTIPAVTFPVFAGTNRGLYREAPNGLVDRNGNHLGYGPGETQARTFMAVIKPAYEVVAFDVKPTGGIVAEFGSTPTFQPIFDLEDGSFPNAFYLWSKGWKDIGFPGALRGPDTPGGSTGPYNGATLFVEWSSSGFDNIEVRINGVLTVLTPSVMPGPTAPATTSFAIGRAISGGLNFFGSISEVFVWDHVLDDDERAQQSQYLAGRYLGLVAPAIMVNDAVRAAQFGRSFREARS
jgi:hypothetical protein